MKSQLRIIIILLFWTNLILSIQLIRNSAETAQAGQIQRVDIVRVAGNWIGGRLPIQRW